MDEFFFMNRKTLPSILPSVTNGATLVMISSMSAGTESHAMKILDMKYDDGTDVVMKLNWIQACASCKKKGLSDKCTHIARPPQHFQSVAGQERVKKLMSTDKASMRREMGNEMEEPDTAYAFESVHIDRMFNHKYVLREEVRHLFITLDPSAGKGGNRYVLVSTIFTSEGNCVVCQLSLYKSKHVFITPRLDSVLDHCINRQCIVKKRVNRSAYTLHIVARLFYRGWMCL